MIRHLHTASRWLHPLIYPAACALSLALLPYQPAQDGPLAATTDASTAASLHCPLRS